MKNLKKSKTPWPTKAVMEQIYEQHLWGGKDHDFYSGEGSHKPDIVNPFLKAVVPFLKSHKNLLTICDLGCGDFNVGQHLVPNSKKYIAIDIVESLIERNKTLFKKDNLEFKCLNIAKEKLPEADCVILRQVLQHLSNTEIQSIVKKLSHYKYIILTEHLPTGQFTPNKDMVSNRSNRLKINSGVVITEPPFNLNVVEEKVLCSIQMEGNKGRIETRLFTVFN